MNMFVLVEQKNIILARTKIFQLWPFLPFRSVSCHNNVCAKSNDPDMPEKLLCTVGIYVNICDGQRT